MSTGRSPRFRQDYGNHASAPTHQIVILNMLSRQDYNRRVVDVTRAALRAGLQHPEKHSAEVKPPGNAGLCTRREEKCESGASRSQRPANRRAKWRSGLVPGTLAKTCPPRRPITTQAVLAVLGESPRRGARAKSRLEIVASIRGAKVGRRRPGKPHSTAPRRRRLGKTRLKVLPLSCGQSHARKSSP